VTFDNLPIALITIFQMITLEGWTDMLYNLSDASHAWMAIVFCVLLVVVGSFFLLNVILAVIMDAFDQVDRNSAA
jgi:type II secretory pathway component PulF